MTAATVTQTHQMIFVNLPVADVARSRAFFTGIGYAVDERMSNDVALGLELGPNHYAMLLERNLFARFHTGAIASRGHHEALISLSADSREAVDVLVDRAIAAGGTTVRSEGAECPFMYGRSYTDLDGHLWEVMWMDVAKAVEAGALNA